MMSIKKYFVLCTLLVATTFSLSAMEDSDQKAILEVIQSYASAWNNHQGTGFADNFTDDADYVNIFGMHFSGKTEIESRHEKILKTFLKNTTLEILSSQLREVQPGFVIALIHWQLNGYTAPPPSTRKVDDIKEGIFTQVFVFTDNQWKITASQNTLIPNHR